MKKANRATKHLVKDWKELKELRAVIDGMKNLEAEFKADMKAYAERALRAFTEKVAEIMVRRMLSKKKGRK